MQLHAIGLVCCLLTTVTVCQITEEPSPITANIGETVKFMCQVSGGKKTEWLEYITRAAGNKIYSSTIGMIGDENKYEIEGTHNLIIKNVQFSDGGLYGCNVEDNVVVVRADLVVMEQPEAYSGQLIEGDTKPISCTTRFMGPPDLVISEEHTPKAEGYIDEDNKFTKYQISTLEEYYVIRIDVNYTGMVGDNGKNLTCRTYTQTPFYEDYGTTVIDVQYEVRDMELVPINEFYYPGEQINCTAKGNPEPGFEWFPELSPGARPITTQYLPIIETMIGENIWKCIATNNVKDSVAIEQTISFLVVEEDAGEGEESISPTTAGWAIALGVLLPLILIALCVLFGTLFWKRRMAPSKSPPVGDSGARSRTKTTPPKPLPGVYPKVQNDSFYEEDATDYYPGYESLPTLQHPARTSNYYNNGINNSYPPSETGSTTNLPFTTYNSQFTNRNQPHNTGYPYGNANMRNPSHIYSQPQAVHVPRNRPPPPQFNPYAVHPGILNAAYQKEITRRKSQYSQENLNAAAVPGETTI